MISFQDAIPPRREHQVNFRKIVKALHREIQTCPSGYILVFGSRSRGHARANSDLDVIIMLKKSPDVSYKDYAALEETISKVAEQFSIEPEILNGKYISDDFLSKIKPIRISTKTKQSPRVHKINTDINNQDWLSFPVLHARDNIKAAIRGFREQNRIVRLPETDEFREIMLKYLYMDVFNAFCHVAKAGKRVLNLFEEPLPVVVLNPREPYTYVPILEIMTKEITVMDKTRPAFAPELREIILSVHDMEELSDDKYLLLEGLEVKILEAWTAWLIALKCPEFLFQKAIQFTFREDKVVAFKDSKSN